jgi:oligoribonuclease
MISPMINAVAPVLAKSDDNLIWIDLEMTGLNPDSDRIIEIAVVVTDSQLTTRVEGPVLAIHQADATLNAMDAWNKATHGRSGLIERVKASTIDETQAQQQVLAFLQQYVGKGKSPMFGAHHARDGGLLSLSESRCQYPERAGPSLEA